MLDMIKAMSDPEFTAKLAEMPEQIVSKLNSIDSKLDLLLQHFSISENLQNGDNVYTGPTDLVIGENPGINPVDPDSYK